MLFWKFPDYLTGSPFLRALRLLHFFPFFCHEGSLKTNELKGSSVTHIYHRYRGSTPQDNQTEKVGYL